MKNQKAMSLIGVIIAIILIVMIVCGAAYFTIKQFEKSRIENVKTNMLLVQGKIKVLQESSVAKKDESILKGKKVADNRENEKVKEMLEKGVISEQDESFDKYYIVDQDTLAEMQIEGSVFGEGNFYIVNYATNEILWTQGITIDGVTYYKLSDLEKLEENANSANTQASEQQNTENAQEQTTQDTQQTTNVA